MGVAGVKNLLRPGLRSLLLRIAFGQLGVI
jgi:hypothetical protein